MSPVGRARPSFIDLFCGAGGLSEGFPSLGVAFESLDPLPETERFLAEIFSACARSPISAAGALGIGSELLVIREYSAMKRSFAEGWSSADYAQFFDANIKEDSQHAAVMEAVGHALVSLGHDGGEFLDAAQCALDARLTYYDALAMR